jgi:hypothetical protein
MPCYRLASIMNEISLFIGVSLLLTSLIFFFFFRSFSYINAIIVNSDVDLWASWIIQFQITVLTAVVPT